MEDINNKFSSISINDYTCPICLNLTIKPIKTECGHTFCKLCLDELIDNFNQEEQKCPMCRKLFTKNFSSKVDFVLDEFLKKNFDADYEKRLKLHEESMAEDAKKIKIRIIYGNTHELVKDPKPSKSNRETQNKHKWGCYVKIDGDESNKIIKKVVFGMHPTFGCTEVVVTKAPFEIRRIGWGTFDIPIKVYLDKVKEPVEFTHELSFNGAGVSKIYNYKIPKA